MPKTTSHSTFDIPPDIGVGFDAGFDVGLDAKIDVRIDIRKVKMLRKDLRLVDVDILERYERKGAEFTT
jgi:hypothetical protein